MPQDTIYIPNQTDPPLQADEAYITTSGDTVYLPDSFFGTGGYQTWKLQNQQHAKEQENYSGNAVTVFLIFMLAFVVLIIKNKKTGKSYGAISRKKIKREDQLATDDR